MKNKAIYGLLMGLVMSTTMNVFAAQPLMLSGRLLNNSTSLPIEEAGVQFNIRIIIEGCTVYSETQTQDLSASSGYFKLVSGSGTINWGNLNWVFNDGNATCQETTSTPIVNSSTVRKVQISVKRASESSFTTFSEENLNSVAFAKIAESLDGKKKEDFIQVAGSVNQSILSQVATYFSAYSTQLLDLVNGTSASYVKPADLSSALGTKQNSLGYVPLNPSNNLSDVSSVAQAKTNLGLGSLASKSSVADSDISDVSWSKISGVPSFAAGSHTHTISDITNLQTSLDSKVAKSSLASCSAAQTLVYTSVSDSFSCVDIAISSSAVSGLGSLATKSSVADSDITDLAGSKLTGGVKVGTVATACDSNSAGLTRYNSGVLEVCNGSAWGPVSTAVTSGSVTSALGYTPLSASANLSDLASASNARTNLGLGSLALKSSLLASDIPSLTLSKISDAGTLASKSTLLVSDIPSLTLSKISDAGSFASKSSLTSTDITTYLGFTPQDKAKLSLNCTAAQTVQYVSATDSYSCQSIAIPSSAVSGLSALATASSVSDAQITDLAGSKLTGGVKIGTVAGSTCSSAGLTRYNSGALEFCNGSSWSVVSSTNGSLPIISDEQSGGTIIIGAVTTAPTKGTISSDSVKYQRIGYQGIFSYSYRQTSAGSAGNGDYLFSLPGGLSFDTGKVSTYTGAISGALTNPAIHSSMLLATASATDNTNGAVAYVVPYSSTQFRILTTLSSTNGTFLSSSNSPLSNSNLSFKANFIAPISGWSSSTNAYVDSSYSVTTGTIISHGSSTCPTGYLPADGSAVSRSTYSSLFTSIGTSYGTGDGSTTFNVPKQRCTTDLDCAQEFSASVNTSASVVRSNVSGWITSCSGTTTKNCVFSAGLFTTAPSCTVSPSGGGDTFVCDIGSITTSGISVACAYPGQYTSNQPIEIRCQKQSPDYKSYPVRNACIKF